MKILLIGATGNIGQRILKEALDKGYKVVAMQRTPDALMTVHPNLKVIKGDLLDEMALPALLKEQDVIISAISAVGGTEQFEKANQNLIAALERQTDKRVIFVGGAGNSEVMPGVRAMNSPLMDQVPEEWKPDIYSHGRVLDYIKRSDLNWVYFSPAMFVAPGERTGKYRLGIANMMVFDHNGESKISYEDYAAALVDEIENKQFTKQQFSIGY
ncbi:MAG TPA: NAD(P)H-binding protein [Flavipsychrobacter sp.]|nr:NAD(P)H-binding protein [Flavipsychrobacter sp.]